MCWYRHMTASSSETLDCLEWWMNKVITKVGKLLITKVTYVVLKYIYQHYPDSNYESVR